MTTQEDLEKEFWSIRRGIFRFRKVLILLAVSGIIIQAYGAMFQYDEDTSFTLEGTDGFVGTFILGTSFFITGVVFLIRSNNQILRLDKQGDLLFGTYDWRLHGENGRTWGK